MKMHVLPLAILHLPDACFLKRRRRGVAIRVDSLNDPHVAHNGTIAHQANVR